MSRDMRFSGGTGVKFTQGPIQCRLRVFREQFKAKAGEHRGDASIQLQALHRPLELLG